MPTKAGKYTAITLEIADQLRKIVGDQYVVYADEEKLEPYSHDEVPDRTYAHMPECLVRPGSSEEIAEIVKLANREHFSVTPRGAGSGLSGGAVPVHGGVVLLFDRMNRILELDPDDMMIVVEPGVITNVINETVAEHGLFYAGYPMSLETCTIGGNVAENAGGGKAVKYGVTSRYVTGLEVVTPTGQIVELGGKVVKDVTGYNMIQLMVGSEGTLGIFTKITLRLLPLPKASVDLLVLFKSVADAVAVVPRVQTASGVIPTCVELLDRPAFTLSCEYLNEELDCQDAEAMLIITLDGPDVEQIEGLISPHQANEDLVVPISGIPKLLRAMKELSKKYGIHVPAYGHAGDGNLHTRIVKDPDMPMDEWRSKLPELLKELHAVASGLGGRLSGEHGIGHKRKDAMGRFVSDAYLDMLRAIKRALDPNNILNPGKIFDL